MKNVSTVITILALIGMLVSYELSKRNYNEIIKAKQKNIESLEHINKISEDIIANKDKIIGLKNERLKSGDSIISKILSLPAKISSPLGFTFGEKKISVEDLLTITNNTLKENISLKNQLQTMNFKLNVIKEKFGVSYKDTSDKIILEDNPQSLLKKNEKLENEVVELKNENILKGEILAFINKKYNIPYFIKDNTINIPYNKLDTLIEVYPLIKKRIKIKNGKIWVTLF